jgi:putative Holliday junction resolvase
VVSVQAARETLLNAKVMGVDLGKRRIGVALSDSGGLMAFPRGVIECSNDRDADLVKLAKLATDAGVATVVVGLPLSLDGTLGPAAEAAQVDTRALRRILAADRVRVVSFDERFTTVSATAALAEGGKRGAAARRVVDAASATVLLQAWIDRR